MVSPIRFDDLLSDFRITRNIRMHHDFIIKIAEILILLTTSRVSTLLYSNQKNSKYIYHLNHRYTDKTKSLN